MQEEDRSWRDAMRPVRLGPFDARLLAFALPAAFFPRLWTLAAVLLAWLAFRAVEARGYRPPAAVRAVRAAMAGKRRAVQRRRLRRALDYGRS